MALTSASRPGEFRRVLKTAFGNLRDFMLAHPYVTLTILYLTSVAIHAVLLLTISIIPSIMADELLFFGLSESLYSGAGVALRGQPVVYPYILYPLLISPVFALPHSFNAYHVIVLINCLAINAVVYPVYALSSWLTRNKGCALAIACVTALMPDLFMAKHVMVESFAYPMLACTLLVIYIQLCAPANRLREAALGLLFVALYALKPGYIAIPAAYYAVSLGFALYKRHKGRALILAISAAGTAAALILFRVLMARCFNIDYSDISQYSAQTPPFTLANIWQAVKGMFAYTGYTLLAFGVLPATAVLRAARCERCERKYFAWILLAASAFILAGCAYMVYVSEYLLNNNAPLRIHTRYVAFLLPAFLAFIPSSEERSSRATVYSPLALCVICLIAISPSALRGAIKYCVDSALLSGLNTLVESGGEAIYIIIALACTAAISAWIARKGSNRANQLASLAFMALLLMTGKVFMYNQDQYGMNNALNSDAAQASLMTGNDALYLCYDGDDVDYTAIALDVNSRCAIRPVTISAMLAATDDTGAVDAILPKSMDSFIYTKAVNAYERPKYIVLKQRLLADLVPYANARSLGDTRFGYYHILEMPDDGKWLHSGMFGLDNNYAVEGSSFLLYDEQLLNNGAVTLYLQAQASQAGAVLGLRTDDGQQFAFTPSSEELEWIAVNISVADPAKGLRVFMESENGYVYIETYRIA